MLKFNHLSKTKWPKWWWNPLVKQHLSQFPRWDTAHQNQDCSVWDLFLSSQYTRSSSLVPPWNGVMPMERARPKLEWFWREVTITTKIFPLNHTDLGSPPPPPSCFLIVTMTMSTLKSPVLNICEMCGPVCISWNCCLDFFQMHYCIWFIFLRFSLQPSSWREGMGIRQPLWRREDSNIMPSSSGNRKKTALKASSKATVERDWCHAKKQVLVAVSVRHLTQERGACFIAIAGVICI